MRRLMRTGICKQYYYGALASMSYTWCASSYAWVNPALAQLLAASSPVPMSLDQSSWVAALPHAGAVLSPLFAGPLADLFGRKSVLMHAAALQVLTWLAVFFTRTLYLLLPLRFFQGCLIGTVGTVLPMYLGEIATPRERGKISVLNAVGWNTGLLLEYLVGSFSNYYTLIWFNTFLPLIFMITFFFANESPYFLLMRGRKEEVVEALESFRDEGTNVKEELEEIESNLRRQSEELSGNWRGLVGSRKGRRALTITLAVTLACYGSGWMTTLTFSDETFGAILGSQGEAEAWTVCMGAGLALTPLVAMATLDRWGRRPALLVSLAGATLAILPAVLFFFLSEVLDAPTLALRVPSVLGILLYSVFIGYGAANVSHLYQAELFPSSSRSKASALASLVSSTASFLTILPYQLIEHNYNIFNFTSYFLILLFALIYSLVSVPETKGKTFKEIQELL